MSLKPEIIGILSWDYAYPKGGMGISLKRIAEQLRAGGKVVRILSPSPDEGIPLTRFTRRFGGHFLFSALLPFTLSSVLHRIHAQRMMIPVGPGGVLLLHRPRVPVVAVVYHTYLQQARLVPGHHWKKIFLPFERRTLNMATHAICFCEDTQRVLQKEYKLKNVSLLPHALDISAERTRIKEEMLVVCVARLEARKGIDVLLAAWPCVLQRLPHARLIIVGRGADERKTDRVISRLSGVLRVHGLSRPELDALVARSAVAVCPAYLEGFGLAAAEAMAAGTAVIASDADGLRNLVQHEQTGLLVPAGDASALADAVVRMLDDTGLRTRLADAARTYIQLHHDPAMSTQAIVDAVSVLA